MLAFAALTAVTTASTPAHAYYVLGIRPHVSDVPALVAGDLGFWKDEGVDIRVWILPAAEDMFKNVRLRYRQSGRGCVDLGISDAGELAYRQVMGLGVVPIAQTAVERGRTQIVLREGVPSLDALQGKRVACDRAGGRTLLLAQALDRAGLSLDDVELVDLGGSDNPQPLLMGHVDAIVIGGDGARRCIAAGGTAVGPPAPASDAVRHCLFAKDWIAQGQPELIDAFVRGYARAQNWVNDPANRDELVALVDKHFYWRDYRLDEPPDNRAYVEHGLGAVELPASIALDAAFNARFAAARTLLERRARQLHDGLRPARLEPLAPPIGVALDDAPAYWRFPEACDYRNHGTAGEKLDLLPRGPETRMTRYGVTPWDYNSGVYIRTAGGFDNDGFGWSTDGVKKYLAAQADALSALDLSGSFSIWLRAANRGTFDTVLVGQGPYDGDRGFAVMYGREQGGLVRFLVTLEGQRHELRLTGIAPGPFYDIGFVYDRQSGMLRGWGCETKTGRPIAQAELQTGGGSLSPANQPLTVGGNIEHDTNMPLAGNIERLAIWDRALDEDAIRALSTGPRDRAARGAHDYPAANLHNVKDYGAVGDGVHDDTDAIQAAIDACIFPVTVKDWKTGRWWYMPDSPTKEGFTFGGMVYIPHGIYKTTRPLVLQQNVTIVGDRAERPVIDSHADVGIVFWRGPWRNREVDFLHRPHTLCSGVTLENLWVRAGRFGGHTMGTQASHFRMRNCRWQGREAGFVCTGFMMFSEIRDCLFDNLWILAKQGARLNTSILENIVINRANRAEEWAIRLEGCIQCVRISEITLEYRGKGIYLDSYASGVTIDLHNIWNYDTGGASEVLRIVNGQGISVRNVMGLDHPATLWIGKDVRNIRIENVQAKAMTFEDAAATRPMLSNIQLQVPLADESLIENDMGGTRDLREE